MFEIYRDNINLSKQFFEFLDAEFLYRLEKERFTI